MVKRQNSSDENIFGSFLKLSERARFNRLLLKVYSLRHMYIHTHTMCIYMLISLGFALSIMLQKGLCVYYFSLED